MGVVRRRQRNPDQVFDIAAPSTGRRRVRVPEIAVGVLLIAGCALAALWWQARINPTISVLVAATPIERGEVLQPGHLSVVELEASEAVSIVDASEYDALLAKISLADIGRGAILDPTLFADTIDVGADEAVIGLFLGPEQVPSLSLRAGSFVDVVLTEGTRPKAAADTATGNSATESPPTASTAEDGPGPSVLAEAARVLRVEPGSGFGQLHVSLVLPRDEAVAAAIAAADGSIVLLEVRSGEVS